MSLFYIWFKQTGLQKQYLPLAQLYWSSYSEDEIYLQDYSDGTTKVCFRD